MTFQGFSEFTKRSFTALILILCFGGSYLHSGLLFTILLGFVLCMILCTEWPKLVPVKPISYILISVLYPITPILCLIALTLRYRDSNFLLPLYPFFIAWTADTAGYLVGKSCGKHKIYPAISPGKSWEGLFGSFIGVFALNIAIVPIITQSRMYTDSIISLLFLGLYSLALTIIAFLGGFLISFLKRKHGLKDTGTLLPGHGGFLDRFDSVFFVVPVIIIIVWVLL